MKAAKLLRLLFDFALLLAFLLALVWWVRP